MNDAQWEELVATARTMGYVYTVVGIPPTVYLSGEKGMLLVRRGSHQSRVYMTTRDKDWEVKDTTPGGILAEAADLIGAPTRREPTGIMNGTASAAR